MPIYEYKCETCHHRFTVLQRMGAGNDELICERCGMPKPTKLFSTFASGGSGSLGGAASSAASGPSGFS